MRQIPFGKPIIGQEEKNAVLDVLNGTTLVHGPKAKQFEKDFAAYTKAPYAVSVASCTAGLHLAYFYLDIGPGDEVIVPSETHVATAHAVELCGAKPVFVDACEKTGNIDVSLIEKKVSKKTKAISVVHYLGMPVDMDSVNAIAKAHKLFVVEDCALALGTYYKGIHAGLHGDVGCFSFYPVKHITTAEGGMLITKDQKIAHAIEKQKAFGVDTPVNERKVAGVYDVTILGFNYRMNELEAAMGIEQLKRIDGFLAKRETNYKFLGSRLKELKDIKLLQSSCDGYKSSYYCMSVILNERIAVKREAIMGYLKDKGVGASIYYPRPVPLLTYYRKKYKYERDSFPVASEISYRSIALPVGPHLNEEDMEYIFHTLRSAITEVK
ncbi:MAG: DegT/DnrJ/EryC1/StrS family aminotransferase [Candidatus Omnitrophica bacterium]|nr:DegT/DnrJ/EryC1/StrS family aminotransferase [Candidatus Omnitrophota bacterium]